MKLGRSKRYQKMKKVYSEDWKRDKVRLLEAEPKLKQLDKKAGTAQKRAKNAKEQGCRPSKVKKLQKEADVATKNTSAAQTMINTKAATSGATSFGGTSRGLNALKIKQMKISKGWLNGLFWMLLVMIFIKLMYSSVTWSGLISTIFFYGSIAYLIFSVFQIFYGVRFYFSTQKWTYFSSFQWIRYMLSIPQIIIAFMLYINY